MSENLKDQSNPFSTGGGGVNFETRIQASFALALVAGISVPGLPLSARARELKFQAKYDGVHTDDFVLFANDKIGNDYKLCAQIKHTITISAQDSMFSEVIKGAWEDFNTTDADGRTDAFALITGPLPRKDVNSTLPILEWARYSATAEEFIKKSTTEGFTSKDKIEKLEAFKIQLKLANNNQELTEEKLWKFLRVFYLLSFDLDSKNSIVGNMMGGLISAHSNEAPCLVVAKLITCVQEFNQNAGTLTLSNIPPDLSILFKPVISYALEEDIRKLRERGDYIFDGISTSIGGIHIPRDEDIAKIEGAFDGAQFIFVTGERGAGKSGVVKDFISARRKNMATFYLRAEDLDKSHLNDVFSVIGMRSTLGQIAEHLSLVENKVLVIESAEKILELNNQTAFTDLLKFIKAQGDWIVIATGRDYAYQKLSFSYLQLCQISFATVNIEGFSDIQLNILCSEATVLRPLVENNSMTSIIKIPFFLELAMRALSNGATFSERDTESEFRNTVWSSVIAHDSYRKGGLHVRRRATFIDIAKKRAKLMLFGVHEKDFDAEAVSALEADHLITKDKGAYISPSHDVLEDWALEEFVNEEYRACSGDPRTFLVAIGSEPAINRGFRLWLQRKLKSDAELRDFVGLILADLSIESYWKDETITAILQSDNVDDFFLTLKPLLLKNNNELLLRFMFILRITCQRSRGLGLKIADDVDALFQTLSLQPYGHGWAALIKFVYEIREQLVASSLPNVVDTLSIWGDGQSIQKVLSDGARIAGLLSLFLLEPIKDTYRKEKIRLKILGVILKVFPVIQNEFKDKIEQDVFVKKHNSDRLAYVDELCQLVLQSDSAVALCKESPDFVIRLAYHEWVKEHEVDMLGQLYSMDIEASYGLDTEHEYSSASGIKGPFKYLFIFHPRKTLDFMINFFNRAVAIFSESKHAAVVDIPSPYKMPNQTALNKIEIKLNNGTSIEQFSSSQLWNGYRGFSTLPGVLQCTLMAFENWLMNYVEKSGPNNEIDWIFNYILTSSNSVMPTAVLASVATAFPNKIGEATLPLLKCSELYKLDILRQSQEKFEGGWFGGGFNSDPLSNLYIQERKIASNRPCRKQSLEHLLLTFQFNQELRDRALTIIDALQAQAVATQDEDLRFMLHRTDSRGFSVVKDKKTSDIYLKTKAELPQDLIKVKADFDQQRKLDLRIQKLFVWTRKAWDERMFDTSRYATHIDALDEARNLVLMLQDDAAVTEFRQMAVGATRTAAALCLRDELETLSEDNFEWVVHIVLDAVIQYADAIDSSAASDATDSFGSVACAYVLLRLFEFDWSEEDFTALKLHLACALTHANHHVRIAVARGIAAYLWQENPDFAAFCMRSVIAYSRFEEEVLQPKRYRQYQDKFKSRTEEISEDIRYFRTEFSEGKNYGESELESINELELEKVYLSVLMIPVDSKDSEHTQLLKKMVEYVYDHQYRNNNDRTTFRLSNIVESTIRKCLVEHVVGARHSNFEDMRDLLLLGCSKAPSFTYLVKLSCDIAMEKLQDFDSIWALWRVLEPGLVAIAKNDLTTRFSGRENDLNRLLRGMLYMDFRDNGHPSNMICLERGADHLLNFMRNNAENSHVYEALCSLIYHFPQMFFADGIGIAMEKYEENSDILHMQVNSAYYLEMSLARYLQVENRGSLTRKMHKVCLVLLTGIIELGSARAYYLRDNLVSARRISN